MKTAIDTLQNNFTPYSGGGLFTVSYDQTATHIALIILAVVIVGFFAFVFINQMLKKRSFFANK